VNQQPTGVVANAAFQHRKGRKNKVAVPIEDFIAQNQDRSNKCVVLISKQKKN
jgi:hypothetical protein